MTPNKGVWELYNLKSNRTEQENLANEHPDKVSELSAKWDQWAERCHVAPKGNPGK